VKNKTTYFKWFSTLFFLIIFAIFLFPTLLRYLALTLVDTHHPSLIKTDAIVVLAGDNGERIKKGVQLFQSQKAPLMIITGNKIYGISVAQLMKDAAIKQGVPSESILIESDSESTLDHPKKCRPIFKAHNVKSITIVTSKFHTSRSYKTFTKELKNDNINISIEYADDGINYSKWWKDHESAEKILLELGKTLWYTLE
jgi:uncharacterized SAM-binding protein YcdF (DUF218 family)